MFTVGDISNRLSVRRPSWIPLVRITGLGNVPGGPVFLRYRKDIAAGFEERSFTIGSYLLRTGLFRGVDKPRCGSGAVICHHPIEPIHPFTPHIYYSQTHTLLHSH